MHVQPMALAMVWYERDTLSGIPATDCLTEFVHVVVVVVCFVFRSNNDLFCSF